MSDRNDSGGTSATRRRWLGLLAAAGAGGVAGCQTAVDDGGTTSTGDGPAADGDLEGSPGQSGTTEPTATGPYSRVFQSAGNAVAVIRTATGQGSGWAYDDEGHFVTNHHVIEGVDELQLHFSGDDWRSGEVVASDVYSDLAVVHVDDPPEYTDALDLADSPPIIGQEVVVIGTPLGFQGSLTAGVVSGTDRGLETPTGFTIPGAVQTDAAVNPGNSGGPMLSLDSEVIGVVSAGGAENIAFGVPNQLTRRVVPALIEEGEYEHPYMGVSLQEVDPAIARANDLDEPTGVIVVEAIDGTPADGVLRGGDVELEDGRQVPVGGDVIVGLDDREITSLPDLSTYLSFETSPGDELSVAVLRDGEQTTEELELGTRPPPSSG